MLLTSVIIVLREVLEAALIVAVLLAAGRHHGVRAGWLRVAGILGAGGALLFARGTGTVTEWAGGVGQELTNAFLQIAIYCCIAALAVLFSGRGRTGIRWFRPLMVTSVSLAITREGSEILLYLSGFIGEADLLLPILTGGVVGCAIGVSVGALAYFTLLGVRDAWAAITCTTVLAVVAAGLLGQAALQLIQADWLPSQSPLWDSSAWLPENSVSGQLLYALIGYEATPTPIQAACYFGGLFLPLGIAAWMHAIGDSAASAEPGKC